MASVVHTAYGAYVDARVDVRRRMATQLCPLTTAVSSICRVLRQRTVWYVQVHALTYGTVLSVNGA